ncbi:MAG: hypothetical protein AUJ82_06080 [Verrucomicrobia bacterium CG1_02_43_26]|nr:MAG: hypothetical protein AUJ82_06080 [Verrucomicrobia bacterium CG1_02_43_26]
MKKDSLPTLYVKSGCPWCADALAFFEEKKIALNIVDVRKDEKALKHLEALTGKHKTPSLEFGDFLVSDFDVDEFIEAASQSPQMKRHFKL